MRYNHIKINKSKVITGSCEYLKEKFLQVYCSSAKKKSRKAKEKNIIGVGAENWKYKTST